jgi:rhamnosyltransferase
MMVVMTSGNLLSLKAFRDVGPFLADFFIDYIDIEYCLKLNYKGYQVLRKNDLILEHNEANLKVRKLFNKNYYPSNNAPIRFYYKTRNLLYLRNQYKNIYSKQMSIEYSAYFRNVIKMLLFEGRKFLKLKMIVLGIGDYLKGAKGRKF